ncbi:helix-turn-helix transcriptional regulator [Mangrovimonas xylaniphaga]|uniref:helix-turn-helix transcriptional regulator n=1 Tax=Mangrovimonas xylaniphaga TaxID=1645915 RepID=UPI0006B4F780|nr:helix-turn-helix domain-containing protein [Mangrovimonas xylaniphaga]
MAKQLHFYQLKPEEFKIDILDGVDDKLKKYLKNLHLPESEELLTVDETLAFLKCSKQALWNWRKNGILPSYRLGNRVYYKRSDIFKKLVRQE